MQNEKTESESPVREKDNGDFRQAKSCLLLIATTMLVIFGLVVAAAVSIVIVDTVNLRGEKHTLSWRVKRYKVACQFLWYDFKEAVSKKDSNPSQEGEP